MAIDRYRYDRNRYRDWETSERDRRDREEGSYGRGWRDEYGYIARRGFGNRSSGYDRERDYEDRYYPGRERDFESVYDDIAQTLRRRVQDKAMEQYVRILAAEAHVEGVDLGAATSPLVR